MNKIKFITYELAQELSVCILNFIKHEVFTSEKNIEKIKLELEQVTTIKIYILIKQHCLFTVFYNLVYDTFLGFTNILIFNYDMIIKFDIIFYNIIMLFDKSYNKNLFVVQFGGGYKISTFTYGFLQHYIDSLSDTYNDDTIFKYVAHNHINVMDYSIWHPRVHLSSHAPPYLI